MGIGSLGVPPVLGFVFGAEDDLGVEDPAPCGVLDPP